MTLLKDAKWVCEQASKRTDVGGINPGGGGGANARSDWAPERASSRATVCKGLGGWVVQSTEAARGEAFPQTLLKLHSEYKRQVFELRNENNV